MSDKTKNVPKIRFPGFTEDWEQRKVMDIAPLQRGFDLPVSEREAGTYPVVMSNGIGAYHSKYKAKAPGVVTGRSGTLGNLTFVEVDYWPHNTALWVTDFKGNDAKFIYYLYQKLDLKRYGTGSGVPTLNRNDVHSTKASIPSAMEQKEISGVFDNIDNLITLHQRKLNNLQNKKKSLLQKMFPKNGADVPEIRFPGFTDAWEQRKLGSSVKFINGRAYKQKELLDKGKYKVLRVGNFNTNNSWYYSDLELEDDKYANAGDLLYLWATSFGPEIWNQERVIYHYHIWKLEIQDKNIDKQYLYTWLETDKERIKQTTNGTTMVHVTKGSIEERQFQFPVEKDEQQKIGEFFKDLDNTITLHQRKLTHLQEQKKALLQQMFV